MDGVRAVQDVQVMGRNDLNEVWAKIGPDDCEVEACTMGARSGIPVPLTREALRQWLNSALAMLDATEA